MLRRDREVELVVVVVEKRRELDESVIFLAASV